MSSGADVGVDAKFRPAGSTLALQRHDSSLDSWTLRVVDCLLDWHVNLPAVRQSDRCHFDNRRHVRLPYRRRLPLRSRRASFSASVAVALVLQAARRKAPDHTASAVRFPYPQASPQHSYTEAAGTAGTGHRPQRKASPVVKHIDDC